MTESRRAALAMTLAAFVFGTTFTAVKSAIEHVQPLPFISMRFLVGAIVLYPFAQRRPRSPGVFRAGTIAGGALTVGYVTQTIGLRYLDESTSAFITYLLVIFVPVLQAVLVRRLPAKSIGIGIVTAALGLFLLSGAGGRRVGLGRGEILTLVCALGFAVHILMLDRLAGQHDVLWLTFVQLLAVAVFCFGPGLIEGGYRFPLKAWLACGYLGVFASAGAFWLQTWAQRRIEPTRASLLLMLEPVFAAALSAVLGRALGARGLVGAALILGGIVVVERGRAREPIHSVDSEQALGIAIPGPT